MKTEREKRFHQKCQNDRVVNSQSDHSTKISSFFANFYYGKTCKYGPKIHKYILPRVPQLTFQLRTKNQFFSLRKKRCRMFAVVHLFLRIVCYHFRAKKMQKFIQMTSLITGRNLSDDESFFYQHTPNISQKFMAHLSRRKHGSVHSNYLSISINKIN